MLPADYRYRAPRRISTPSASPGLCPFCREPGYKAPGPCTHCNTFGYHSEEPVLYRRPKFRRGKSDPPHEGIPDNFGHSYADDALLDREEPENLGDFLSNTSLQTEQD